jgi:hypothetical protein
MDFKEATDLLGRTITQADVARAAGVSHHSVRQARLARDHPAHRKPPASWPAAVARLARERSDDLIRLALTLEGAPVEAEPTLSPVPLPTPSPVPAPAPPPAEAVPSPSLTQRLLRRLMK